MPLYLTIVCLLLSYMYECSLVNLLMEEIKIMKALVYQFFFIIQIFFDFSLTVKAAPHECVIRTGQP